MLRSLRTAEQAMQFDQMRVETLANNLANLDASGFKQVLTSVEELARGGGMDPDTAGESLAADTRRRVLAGRDAWPGQNPLRMNHITDPRSGPILATGRATDVAVAGEGYFVVETPAGERYTRDGAFRLDGRNQLVTAAGAPVQGEGGPLRVEGGAYALREDGSLVVGDAVIGRLRLVSFAEPARLEHQGSSLLSAPPDLEPVDIPRTDVRLLQGHLEGSNVDPIATLVDMIAAQRSFEVASRVVNANDETLEKSVNQLPRSR